MRLVTVCLLALAVPLLAACGDDPAHDHDHGGDAHGHGDAHVHVAPRGGDLVVAREEFAHVEMLLDPEAGTLSAFLLDAHAVKPVRSAATSVPVRVTVGDATFDLDLAPVASELSGETVGDTSHFRVADPRLNGAAHVDGTIRTVEIKGEAYTDLPFHVPVH